MKLKVKVKSAQLPEYNSIFTSAFHKAIDVMDYADFYNSQSVLKMIADSIYKNNLMHRADRVLSIDLNQYKTLRMIINHSQKEVLPSVYEFVLINTLFNECERQIGIIRHKQQSFYNQFNSLMIGGGDA